MGRIPETLATLRLASVRLLTLDEGFSRLWGKPVSVLGDGSKSGHVCGTQAQSRSRVGCIFHQ